MDVIMTEGRLENGQVSKEETDLVVSTLVDVLKIPTISGGHFTENEHFINISSLWSVNDLAKKDNVLFQRSFSVLKSSLIWKEDQTVLDPDELIISSTSAVPFEGKKICISKNGNRKAILIEKKAGTDGTAKTDILQIWSSKTLVKTYDLGELDKHKAVYTTGAFGSTMVWSMDSNKLAYLAEKKVPKPKPFFISNVKKDPNANENSKEKHDEDDSGTRGEEYAYQQTWGEQLKDMFYSVIVILDTETDCFKVIELPKDEFPTDIHWVNNSSIVGTSYKIPVWRLGLIYCTNRESRIFQVDIDGNNLKFFSSAGRAAFSPRIKPGGSFLIWQERAVDGPHNRSRSIMGIPLPDGKHPICLYPRTLPNEILVYQDFPKNCWSPDGTKFYFITPSEGISKLLSVSLQNGAVMEIKNVLNEAPSVENILWVGQNYMLVSRSSALLTPYFELVELHKDHRRVIINKPESPVPDQKIVIEHFYGLSTAPSIYIGPIMSTVQPNTVPFIVLPHGGPHGVYVDLFGPETALFSRLGYAMVKVNFIGSLGSKTDETDKLLGHIGSMDVKDCHEIAEKIIKAVPCINPDQVVVYGGSHGGFLSGHLSSYAPEFYKAAVMLNPVCDLNGFIGTSDITDWVMAEAGVPFPVSPLQTFIPAAKSDSETQAYMKCSPIINVSKVKAPTLLVLGSEDLRVTMSQGMAYYRALKAYNKTTEVRVYPDCHPLSKVPVQMDRIVHTALWFKRFLK